MGNDFTSTFSQATSYDGTSTSFAFTTTDPLSPVNGRVYRIYTVASNVFGDSEPSQQVIIGLGAKPPAPTTGPLRTPSTTMLLSWPSVTISDLPVLGYILEMDDGLGGDFVTVYDGSLNP